MAGELKYEPGLFLSTLPADRAQRRLALAVTLVSAAIFAALVPFAQVQLAPLPAFIPVYQSALVVGDLITAVLLFQQFSIVGSRGLLVLACAYLFSALIAGIHLLTFPGLFAPGGLLGAGPQTTAWLYMFWHGGFAALVIAYALLKNDGGRAAHAPAPPIVAGGTVVAVAVLGFALLATAGHDLLPAIMLGNRYGPTMIAVVSTVWILSILALAALWLRRPRSVLDLWLMVVMCAWLFDIALAAVLNAGRYDLGFYAGRVYGLLAATFLLCVLLLENGVLYAALARALHSERAEHRRVEEKTAQLNELNATLEQRVTARTAEVEAVNQNLLQEVVHRARAELDSLEAGQRLDGIIGSAMDAIITVDERQRIVLFNAAAETIFGCTRAEALGAPLAVFIPERFRSAHLAHLERFGSTETAPRRMSAQRIVTGLRRNGEEFPIDASISHVAMHGGEYYTVILRDVSERVRAEEALRRSREELHEMAMLGATAREQEKRRIARELHDDLAQDLAALKMDLGWLAESPAVAEEEVAARITAMEELVDGTVAATRRIAADLRPPVLDLGLAPATQWLVTAFAQRHGIQCELAVDPPGLDLADPHSTAVFRIIQESLTNVARHAQASRVQVDLRLAESEVRLRVRDNGRGFDPASPRKPTSFGLVGLRERAHLVTGTIRIETAPGQGTTIEVSIPVPSSPRAS